MRVIWRVMTRWIIGVIAGLLVAAGFAFAGEMTPGTSSDDNADVQAQIDPWLDEVEIYRAATDALSGEWQTGAANAAVHTEIYTTAGAHFVIATRATSARIRELSPGNDAACIMRGISLDVTERLEALGAAADAAAHIEVLRGIDRLLYEGLLIFGREQEARRAIQAPIRVAYMVKSDDANAYPAAGPAAGPGAGEDCDTPPKPTKAS